MVQVSGFFDFIGTLAHYDGLNQPVIRLNKRHAFLIDAFRTEIAGARVLDLAAHDGRWSYAFAGAGAAEVVGIEARQELVDLFDTYPDPVLRAVVDLRCGDIFDGLEAEIAKGARYDVVAVLGILYHIMDHFRLFQLIRKLGPKLVIVDSEFMLRDAPMIQLVRERTDNILNAAPQIAGQEIAIKGVPSFAAMEVIADVLAYELTWSDWEELPKGRREGVADYYREQKMRRATCVLRPRG
ncbi:MAG: class I SAM-dependent methyltransferase [Rhodobacterales bacterium]|nr:class I SAM-dependent methyltransferase [Rhodobacterales bacterium]NCT13244.1 class I SAM-dependent methyltransferase [Rhodobacterales bacterium]